jgi:hypothetical protein
MGGAVPPLPNTPSWHGAQLGGTGTLLFTLVTTSEFSARRELSAVKIVMFGL